MKFVKPVMLAVAALLSVVVAPAEAIDLPNTGTYFIISNSSGEALQPVGPTVAQNVLLYPANKGGLQKWVVTRHVDPKTKKPTNRYDIRLAGEASDLNFQPHDIADRTAIVLPDKSTFVLEVAGDGILVKSVKRNGDALFVYPYPPMNSEARFGASDGSSKFQWTFDPAN
jgi:hypothetical protein